MSLLRPAVPMRSIRALALLALVLAASAAWPATAPDAPAGAASAATVAHAEERARIARERAAADALFHSRERECRERFIVTSCLNDAKSERRQTLDRLRARQIVIDEARRHERADVRRTELADKAAEDVRRESARATRGAASAASDAASQPGRGFVSRRSQAAKGPAAAASEPHDRTHPPANAGIKPRPQASKATREQREVTNRAAFEARKAEAAGHRDETIERTTRRMAQKSPAAPLPSLGAASAASHSASRP